MSALTGALLLGWSGGGFIGVGDQYLFMTLTAVGGASLLDGLDGYVRKDRFLSSTRLGVTY